MITIVCVNQRITTRQLALRLSISKGSVLTAGREAISSEFVARFAAEGKFFLSRNFTPGETCVHHFEPETKSTQ
jgi:hypothetical protein